MFMRPRASSFTVPRASRMRLSRAVARSGQARRCASVGAFPVRHRAIVAVSGYAQPEDEAAPITARDRPRVPTIFPMSFRGASVLVEWTDKATPRGDTANRAQGKH
jgi:hypothetical protein